MTTKTENVGIGSKEVESWQDGVKFVLDASVNALEDEVTKKGTPIGVCVFVCHSSGEVTVVNGGPSLASAQHVLSATACGEVQRQLMLMAEDAMTQEAAQDNLRAVLRKALGL